jgi:hypothetical protein
MDPVIDRRRSRAEPFLPGRRDPTPHGSQQHLAGCEGCGRGRRVVQRRKAAALGRDGQVVTRRYTLADADAIAFSQASGRGAPAATAPFEADAAHIAFAAPRSASASVSPNANSPSFEFARGSTPTRLDARAEIVMSSQRWLPATTSATASVCGAWRSTEQPPCGMRGRRTND